MWIDRRFFDMLTADNKQQQEHLTVVHKANDLLVGEHLALKQQKAKDDLHIDWLRNRVNALEKQNAVLLMRVAGVAMPVPEIVRTMPGTEIDFDTMPDFEDAGDKKAALLGISHDEFGGLVHTK
jgi:hypothetical protein